jgi:hypothetical protein
MKLRVNICISQSVPDLILFTIIIFPIFQYGLEFISFLTEERDRPG